VVVASAGPYEVCTSLQTDNHTSTPPLSFLQAGCLSCRPTNSVKALKANHKSRTNGSKQCGKNEEKISGKYQVSNDITVWAGGKSTEKVEHFCDLGRTVTDMGKSENCKNWKGKFCVWKTREYLEEQKTEH